MVILQQLGAQLPAVQDRCLDAASWRCKPLECVDIVASGQPMAKVGVKAGTAGTFSNNLCKYTGPQGPKNAGVGCMLARTQAKAQHRFCVHHSCPP